MAVKAGVAERLRPRPSVNVTATFRAERRDGNRREQESTEQGAFHIRRLKRLSTADLDSYGAGCSNQHLPLRRRQGSGSNKRVDLITKGSQLITGWVSLSIV